MLSKGLAKLGNNIAETLLLRRQMFPGFATWETGVAETNFAARKQKMFLPEVKNIFASRTQMLLSKHMFPSLASVKTMLTRFQCCSLRIFPRRQANNNGRRRSRSRREGKEGKKLEGRGERITHCFVCGK